MLLWPRREDGPTHTLSSCEGVELLFEVPISKISANVENHIICQYRQN